MLPPPSTTNPSLFPVVGAAPSFDWAEFYAGIRAGLSDRPAPPGHALRPLSSAAACAWQRFGEDVEGEGERAPVAPGALPSLGLSSTHISPRTSHSDWLDAASADHSAGYALNPWLHHFRRICRDEPQTVTIAEGGNYVRYHEPAAHWGRVGKGGSRGRVTMFSEDSRRRLLRRCNQVNRSNISPERVWFITLTYPASWPGDPHQWKRDLQDWQKRLYRRWGIMSAIWKLEPQKRGAPHFHLLLFVPAAFACGLEFVKWYRDRKGRKRALWRGGKLLEFRSWLAQSWFEVVGSGDPKHLEAGTQCDPLFSWRGVIRYASVYLGKATCFADPETGEVLPVGRFWGIWGEDALIKLVRHSIPRRAWYSAARALLRTAACRGLLRRGGSRTLFAPAEDVERLLRLAYEGFGRIPWPEYKKGHPPPWWESQPPDTFDGEGRPAWTVVDLPDELEA